MAEHGTRTMYVHYGCRCDECCKAEHRQYLKRKEAQTRRRCRSKWSGDELPEPHEGITRRQETQRKHNAIRYKAFKERPSTHTRPIVWQELVGTNGLRCNICGRDCDPNDTWIGDDGIKRYGRTYPTVDHILPLRHGGTDTLDNVQLACKHCNSSKGAKVYDTIKS